MVTKFATAAFAATIVFGESANAFQAIRHTDQIPFEYSHRYLILNADVNRHYRNEVIFAGRYLGADPDPRIRLNLRIDRPDGK